MGSSEKRAGRRVRRRGRGPVVVLAVVVWAPGPVDDPRRAQRPRDMLKTGGGGGATQGRTHARSARAVLRLRAGFLRNQPASPREGAKSGPEGAIATRGDPTERRPLGASGTSTTTGGGGGGATLGHAQGRVSSASAALRFCRAVVAAFIASLFSARP